MNEGDLEKEGNLVKLDGHATATVLTPRGKSAVTTIQVQGPAARQTLTQFFRPRQPQRWHTQRPGDFFYGHWVAPQNDDQAEDLLICLLAPACFEIHCHGGELPVRRILKQLLGAGIAEVSPWEQLVTEADDLLQAEARWLLSQTGCTEPAHILARQVQGALSGQVRHLAQACAAADFTEAERVTGELLKSWPWGRWVTQPFRVVLYGSPNVGKSSLINALLGYERTIVYDQPGTTRDVIAARTVVAGWPIELLDTAGIRQASPDPLEQAGMRRAQQVLAQADLLVLVTEPTEGQWQSVPDGLTSQVLRVVHKSDLGVTLESGDEFLTTSVVNPHGIDTLLTRIGQAIVPEAACPVAVVFTPRQLTLLHRVAKHLASRNAPQAALTVASLLSDESVSPPTIH